MYFKPNYLLAIALLPFVVSLAGCGKTQFVVLHDVPESPSFVVIPANNYFHEVKFANDIENAIIGVGLKVVMRPATKDVTTEKTVQGAEGKQTDDSALIQSADAKLIERYFGISSFEDIDADYIVLTYVNFEQVKIAKRETREILAVLEISKFDRFPSWRMTIHKAFVEMGIPVAKK